jgi:hypothetical protein
MVSAIKYSSRIGLNGIEQKTCLEPNNEPIGLYFGMNFSALGREDHQLGTVAASFSADRPLTRGQKWEQNVP